MSRTTPVPSRLLEPKSAVSAAAVDALDGYKSALIPRSAELGLIFAFVILTGFTTIEAPLRYGFTLLGAPWLIYLRDLALVVAMLFLGMQQFWRRQLQGAFILFAVLFIFHGIASFLLCGVPLAVLIGLKTLIPPLFGAIFLPIMLRRSHLLGWLLLAMWVISAAGIIVDFAGYSLPWKGMSATVGDYTVVINKKWNFEGEDRIGGFARDSVVAGTLVAMFGLYVMLVYRSLIMRAVIAVATAVLIYLTTSKGGLIAFVFAVIACLMPMKKSQLLNKVMLASIFAAMVLLPVVLPNFLMPSSPAVLLSFFDRVERVWPAAWHNIDMHSWIFGAAIGNIGVGQQFLRFQDVDTGDNLFVIAYGYFGIFSLIYLCLPLFAALRRKVPVDQLGRYAIITLIYVFAFGIVINAVENSLAAFMFGGACQALALRRDARWQESDRRTSREAGVTPG